MRLYSLWFSVEISWPDKLKNSGVSFWQKKYHWRCLWSCVGSMVNSSIRTMWSKVWHFPWILGNGLYNLNLTALTYSPLGMLCLLVLVWQLLYYGFVYCPSFRPMKGIHVEKSTRPRLDSRNGSRKGLAYCVWMSKSAFGFLTESELGIPPESHSWQNVIFHSFYTPQYSAIPDPNIINQKNICKPQSKLNQWEKWKKFSKILAK